MRLLLIAAAAAVLATPVHAQNTPVPHSTTVAQTPVPHSTTDAQGGNVLTGVDIMTSTVMQEHQSSFSGIGARARLNPPALVKDLTLMPSIEYWRNKTSVDTYDIRTSRKDATLAFDVRYNFHPAGWEPYIGAGYAIHFLSSNVNAPSLGLNDASDSLIKGGLAALGGVSFPLSDRFDSILELKYHHIPDYSQLKFSWGLAYRL